MDRAAEAVLTAATAAAVAGFGDDLVAVHTIGSLAHGGFAPLVSDVDVALVLRRTDARTAGRVHRLTGRVRSGSASVLAERLSVFWADPDTVRHGPGRAPARLPAADRLDLVDSGVLRHGADVRAGAVRPDRATLVAEAAAFALARFGADRAGALTDPDGLVRAGPRPVTKTVLFPVRFLHTLRTGQVGRNDAAAASYTGPHRALDAAALRWRTAGLGDRAAASGLLAAHLPGLYREFVDAHLAALPAGAATRAGLAALRDAVDPPAGSRTVHFGHDV